MGNLFPAVLHSLDLSLGQHLQQREEKMGKGAVHLSLRMQQDRNSEHPFHWEDGEV